MMKENELHRGLMISKRKYPASIRRAAIPRPTAPARRLFFTLCAIVLALAGCAESVKHDETSAAKSALEFGKVALVEKDLDRAYDLLSDSGKRHVPRDKFKQSLSALHGRNAPTRLTATDYEPMADEKAIYIFIRGQNGEEQFQYRFTMTGSAGTDYKVLKVDQGSGFFTLANKKQPFKPPITAD